MKKIFTLVAMAFVAVCANAQAVVAEIDWTTQTAYYEGVWYDNSTAALSFDNGLVIDCTADGTGNYWEPQVPMIAHIPEVAEGGQYQVVFTVDAPAAGEIRLDFCSWDGSSATHAKVINVEAGEKEYTVDFEDYPTPCTDAMIFYQCGKMPGKHVIKKVTVIDLEGEGGGGEEGPGLVGEIDWTSQSAYYDGVWYDNSTAALSFDNGLVIDCTADGTGNYWEPQVPMIFYQCGKMPGKHVIKYVKVYDLEATGIEAVKASKAFDGAIYNLAGQKVNANYKGVVIQNGKKFIQK